MRYVPGFDTEARYWVWMAGTTAGSRYRTACGETRSVIGLPDRCACGLEPIEVKED